MVFCIIPSCEVKSGNKEGISLFRIPIIVDKNGESYRQLTRRSPKRVDFTDKPRRHEIERHLEK